MAEKTILVADDESHILNVVSLKLRNAGYKVITACDGQEALELATSEKPDLLITDYHMPRLSGIELCRRLKQDSRTDSIPTIMLTARGYHLEEQDPADHGIMEMMSKPFSPRHLLSTVTDVLERAAKRRPPRKSTDIQLEIRRTMLQIENNTKTAGESPFPAPVLERVAARFRPAGVCLLMAAPDGCIYYADPVAGAFFARYAVPLVRQNLVLAEKLRRLPADAPAVAFDSVPGIILSAYPYVERKQILGIPLLAARSTQFRTGEDVLQACGRLELDATWLARQADSISAFSRDALTRQVSLVGSMLHDRLKLSGMELELNSLSEQLANSYEELSLIYQISGGMRVNRRASDFFKQACHDVLDVMNVQGVGICLLGEGTSRVEPALYGSASIPTQSLHRMIDELIPLLRKRKGPVLVADVQSDENFSWLTGFAATLLAVPLMRQDQVLGCMFAVNKQSGDFDSVDSKLLNSIATESAIYVENSSLYDDVHGLMMGLLHSLTSAVDAKDAYTCGHSERVALLSRHLAQEIGLPDAEVDQIYMAGLLHDVGKIGVPESVLQKTGKLTNEEFELMKKHPQIGARILSDVKQVKALIPGVLHHHERYDGKGYPTGLSGNNIPLMGRIICLADCFDAMTSNRTYRKALPLEVAVTEIRRCAGTQFDPALAEAFVKTGPDRFRELLRNHAEKSKMLLELQETLRTN